MPRKPSDKPWPHKASGFWCATINGEREYLDKDYKVACRKLKALRAALERGERISGDWLDAPFAELADEYLEDIKGRRKPATYTAMQYRLTRSIKVFGTGLRVGDVRKIHLARIERDMLPNYSPTTVKDTIAAVQSVYHWAVKMEILDANPLVGYEKPRARRRTRTITDDEFNLLLALTDPNFQNFLHSLRETGCRPGELRNLTWECVDLDRQLWIISDHKTITRQKDPRPRIIPLSPHVLAICRTLAEQPHKPEDHVFLNMHGKPYKKDTVVRKLDRLRKRAGIQSKGGEQIVLYSNRHTFGTQAAGSVTDIELAELMGHTDVRMTQRYVHLNPDRLHKIRRRVSGQ